MGGGWMEPLVALLAGVLILVMPNLLNRVVAVYFIVIGAMGLSQGGGPPLVVIKHLVPLVAGVLILVHPRLLNTIIAVTLILVGALGLMR